MKPIEDIKIDADWLNKSSLQKLFDILCADGGEAMVAGGAVRNALMHKPVNDVDLCTTVLPEDVVLRLEAAGEKAVPTGIEHGTITAIVDGDPYEVTTVREDVETDGRHAIVKFGTDWENDARRRDLTINALYCDRVGDIFDPVEGYSDILASEVRFIGDATERIKEDALRILRFFRFFAWYGEGRPDASGLKACAANKQLLNGLSVERVWMELKKLLAADDPGRALLWMRTTGILSGILHETEKWGIDSIPPLIRLEKEQDWQPDALRRLMAVVRPDVETVEALASRLFLSNAEADRLRDWAGSSTPKPDTATTELEMLLYRGSCQGILDAMRLEVIHLVGREDEAGADAMLGLIQHAEKWERPVMPVQGRDLIEAGMVAGPEMGAKLKTLEEAWIESGFALDKDALLGMK